jgi:hypothetical protein
MGAGNQGAAMTPLLWIAAVFALLCLGGCGIIVIDIVHIFQGGK